MPKPKQLAENRRKPKCVKGTACGFSCISGKYTCSSKILKRDADALIKSALAGLLGKKPETGRKTSLEAQSETLDAVKLEPVRTGSTTSMSEKWGKSFDNAPELLRVALKSIDQPIEIAKEGELNAYYSPGSPGVPSRMHMAGYDVNTDKGASVYRHELGHHLDHVLAPPKPLSTVEALLGGIAASGKEDPLDILKDPEARAKFEAFVGRKIGDDNDLWAAASQPNTPETRAVGYFSSTKEMDEAMRKDEHSLLDRFLITPVKDKKSKSELASRMSEVENDLIASRHFANEDYARALNRLDTKLTYKAENRTDAENGEAIDKMPSNDLAQKLLKSMPDALSNSPSQSIAIERVAIGKAKLEDIITLVEKTTKNPELAADLLGALTKNKLGYGHSDEYYEGPGAQNTEAFANITAIHGSGHPLADEILTTLVPESYKQYKKALKGLTK